MSEPKNQPEPESNDVSQAEGPLLDDAKAALNVAADLFRPFGMKPSPIAWSGEAVGVLVGELCDERHVMFVHLDAQRPADPLSALEPSPEELAHAKDLLATPHVLRCVLGPMDGLDLNLIAYLRDYGVERTLTALLGAARFDDHVARSNGYARSLCGRVTVAGHLSRLGGRLSRLRLGIIRTDIQLALRLWIDDREPAFRISRIQTAPPRSGNPMLSGHLRASPPVILEWQGHFRELLMRRAGMHGVPRGLHCGP